ncbi:hypothetical protein DPMN_014286 [Dreissena polymorpha]|uniref:Uncharacterized protein n=1 Tax=Dreissena polymorpha TaxID=45954 RepID=A0A9D4NAH4_DREPO|nr:hypothetical protein DPMN_014286 [Dreissena polymorpha]
MIEENTFSASIGKQELGLTIGLSCLLLSLYIAMAGIVYWPRRKPIDTNSFSLPTRRLSQIT